VLVESSAAAPPPLLPILQELLAASPTPLTWQNVLKGSREEIAEGLARIRGEVREAIVFVEPSAAPSGQEVLDHADDIFAEMEPYVAEGNTAVDDSREAIYTRLEGE
jgi:hypothetical protein